MAADDTRRQSVNRLNRVYGNDKLCHRNVQILRFFSIYKNKKIYVSDRKDIPACHVNPKTDTYRTDTKKSSCHPRLSIGVVD